MGNRKASDAPWVGLLARHRRAMRKYHRRDREKVLNMSLAQRKIKMKPRVSRGHSSLGTPGQAAADARKKTHRGTPQG